MREKEKYFNSVCVVKTNKTNKQVLCRAAGDRSGRKYSEKYVFMSKNMIFGTLGSLLPFSPPPKLIKKQKFSQMIFFAVFLCHIEPTCQKLCFYNKNCKFWPLGPLLPYLKGPPNSSKTEIFKNYNVFCLNLSH